MNHEEITETKARLLIGTGQAGYWEASLRDSISKQPIPHDKWVCVFVGGQWFKVSASVFKIVPMGRHSLTDNASAALHTIECHGTWLAAKVQDEINAKGVKIDRI